MERVYRIVQFSVVAKALNGIRKQYVIIDYSIGQGEMT